ncbi:sec-independent protein translocase protein TatB [Actinocatenispora thailandica]|uniref:Sec-independent protein translocase protein TatB n=1 Tax=Actinocatenispora thailandica TaxID=227318 RepID=A0A7R7DS79_9ACTN|nr:sec-independent translocase [Actinocatenispora thailandica]BCJ36853.1 sec-independent protein translocase protein TatB [Actinocatenispora thailandica]
MFDSLGWPEILVLVLIGLFIFGPDKLPKLISDGVNMIRQLRRMATNATGDLSRELGTDISLEDLHPKTFVRKHILSEDDQDAIIRPFKEVYSDASDAAGSLDLNSALNDDDTPAVDSGSRRRPRFDVDAT